MKTEDRLSYQLAQTEHLVRRAIERELRAEGLGLLAWAVLSWICREPGLSVTELSARVFVSQQAVSKLVASLARAELLESRPREGRRRVRDLVPTDSGRKVSAACDNRVLSVEMHLRNSLMPSQADALGDALRACQQAFAGREPTRVQSRS